MVIQDTETRRRPLGALIVARLISLVGSQVTLVALPWFVLVTTGSAAKTGLTGLAVTLPAVIVGLAGGALVDRLDYRRTSVIADLTSAAGIAAIPLLYHTTGIAFWQLLALVFIGSLLTVPGLTARRSMLPELARAAGLTLDRANSIAESGAYVALLLGPPLAGVLIAFFGAANVLWLDAASFVASAAIVAGGIPAAFSETGQSAPGRYLDDLKAGLRFVRDDRLLLALALGLTVSNFFTEPFFAVVVPVYANRVLGSARALGLMFSAIGAGLLVGGGLYGAVGARFSRRSLWVAAFMLGFPVFLVLLFEPPLPVILAAFGLGAAASGPINPILVTVRLERIPSELRGRVFGTFTSISSAVIPLGMALGGVLIAVIGLKATIVIMALGDASVAVASLLLPVLREMDSSRGTGE
ncbi:MAG TPA: MFS transporter [Thermomicrobiaceae bacterium]|nr:MFS transporter [Thermomicrobiaceae bacterium]